MTEKRQVFFSFHYERDCQRAAMVRNIGAVTNEEPLSDNAWEEVKKGGEGAVKKWIDDQLKMRSCTVVLIGQETAGRPWIDYEIQKSWELGKGIVGIYIHNLKNLDGVQAPKGENPFLRFKVGDAPLSNIIKTYCESDWQDSKEAFGEISNNIADWVEEAIEIRKQYKDAMIEIDENAKTICKLNRIGKSLSAALSAGALGVGTNGIVTSVARGAGNPTKFYGDKM